MTTSEGTHKVATSRRQYSPPNKRANWATAIFALLGIITLFSLFAAIGDIQTHQATQTVGSAADTGVTKTGMLTTAVSMLAAITFLAWQHRASKNIEPLTTKKPKYSPAAAVLFWFIPLVSLVLPYLVMKELWKDSHPDGAESPMSPVHRPVVDHLDRVPVDRRPHHPAFLQQPVVIHPGSSWEMSQES